MNEPPELVSSSDDEGSWADPLLDGTAEDLPAASQEDFLSSQGFSAGFFDSGAHARVARDDPPAATGAGGGVIVPPLEQPFSNLRILQAQLRTLQDQLRTINDGDDMGPYSSGQPGDVELWDDVDDEVERAMADLETRGMVAGQRGGSLFGPADTLSRLLSHMLGLGAGGARALGGDDRSHTLRMLDLGFPTAVDPNRYAALAAEGVPAGRMVGAKDEPGPRPSSPPPLTHLLDLMDLSIGPPMQAPFLGGRGEMFGVAAGGARAVPSTVGQRRRFFVWGGSGSMPELVPDDDESSQAGSEVYLTDGDGPPAAAGSSEGPQPQRRRRDGAAQQQQQWGALRRALGPSGLPALVSDASGSSSEGSGAEDWGREQRPAERQRRVVRAARRQARPQVTGSRPAGNEDDHAPPPLISDDDVSSGSDGEGPPAARDFTSRRGSSTGLFGSRRAGQGMVPQRASRSAGASRQQQQQQLGGEDEPPPLQSDADFSSEPSESEREGEGGPAWASYYFSLPGLRGAQREQQQQPLQRQRRRRDAIFGQLPGLGGRSPLELLEGGVGEQQLSEAGSEGPPRLESEEGEESGSEESSGSEGAPSWPGLVPDSEAEGGSSDEDEEPPSLDSDISSSEGSSSASEAGDDEPGTNAAALPGCASGAAVAHGSSGSSLPPQHWGRRVLGSTQRLGTMNVQLAVEGGHGAGYEREEGEEGDMPCPLTLHGSPAPQPLSLEDALALEGTARPALPLPPLENAVHPRAGLAAAACALDCAGPAAAAGAGAHGSVTADAVVWAPGRQGPGCAEEGAGCSIPAAKGAALVAGAAGRESQAPMPPEPRRRPSMVGRVLDAGAGLVRWITGGHSQDQSGS